MNIDVREYLRINPISVHDLTLSGDGKDCFLVFGNALDGGYRAVTQNAVFRTLYQRIFGNLLNSSVTGFNLSSTNPPRWNICNLTDDQFSDFVRRNGKNSSDMSAYIPYKNSIESWLTGLENAVEAKIRALRLRAKTWSRGAVEYKANSFTPYYDHSTNDYERLKGITWCYDQSGEDISGTGLDQVEMAEPIKHNHPDSRAETLTVPYTTKKGGGELIAECGIGVKDMVSYNEWPKSSSALTQKQDFALTQDDELTQPLYGQNILDWRNRQRTHNNIPPAANVFAMRVKQDITSVHSPLVQRGLVEMVEVVPKDVVDKPVSYVAAQYYSSTVQDLGDSYGEANLTTHDYMLRIQYKNGQAIELMKQTVQMLLDIFGEDAFNLFSIKDANGNLLWPMEDILKLKLDELLVPEHEFAGWYNGIVDRMSNLNDRIQLYRQMLLSIKPLNYVGRIVMTSTDDTEQKVIRNYGGKKWRRIVNFLRGVDAWNELGTKLGEEYVCLRESNIPVHTHAMTTAESPSAALVWQMKKDTGSNDTKIVDVGQTNGGIKLQNRTLDYQISPLECEQMEMILPHDNMPPYREIYFWECLDPTDDEVGLYVVTWDSNCELKSPDPRYYSSRTKEKLGAIPTLGARTGYVFSGWYDDEGKQPDSNWEVDRSIVYHARWNANTYTITFNHNNGTPPFSETRTRRYGEKVGVTPEPRRPNVDLEMKRIKFDGWFNSKTGGTKITKDTTVTGNATYYAHWNISTIEHPVVNVTFDATGGTFSGGAGTKVIQRNWGTNVGTLPVNPAKSHYIFDGWWTKTKSGTRVTSNTTVNGDVTFYAHWIADQFTITYNLMGGTLPAGRTNPTEYTSDTKTFTLVNPSKVGYTFNGWYGTGLDPQYQKTVTIPRGSSGNKSFTANWIATEYSILYNMNGHGVVPTRAWRKYTIESSTYSPPNPDSVLGYRFIEWTPPNIPHGSTGNKNFSAIWNVNMRTATFNANGGTGGTTKTQDYGTPLYAPVVTRTGYTFDSWEPEVPLTMPDADCTFTARWQAVVYTIVFDANGGSGGETIQQAYGTTVTIPGTTRTGYTLVGWFTAPTGGNEIDNSLVVTGNATYYARWAIINYAVSYDTNGVATTVPSTADYPRTHTIDDTITPPALNDAPPYVFNEWEPQTMPYGTVGDQTFVAQWEVEQFTVTFAANGGELEGVATRILDYGSLVGEPPVATNEGYSLVGWYDSIEGGNLLTNSTRVTGNITYYARWSVSQYNVTFVGNGGKWEGDIESITGTQAYGSRLVFPQSNPSHEQIWGITVFDTWYTAPSGGQVVDANTVVTSDVTYYAHWTRYVRYNNNGGVTIRNGVASGFSTTKHLVTKEELDFSNQFEIVMKAKTGSDITSNQEVLASTKAGSNLEFGVKSGKFAWEFVDREHWDVTTEAVKPTANKNYWFKYARESDNWLRCYISTNGVNWTRDYQINQPLATYVSTLMIGVDPEANTQYWRGNIDLDSSYINIGGYKYLFIFNDTIDVTFNPCNGDSTTSLTLELGNALGTLPAPTMTGYILTGWFTEESGGNSVDSGTIPIQDTTYYAHWEEDPIEVTYHANYPQSETITIRLHKNY